MMQTETPLDPATAPSSPSFSYHSSDTLPHIAARVTLSDPSQQNDNVDVSDDFEFSFVSRHPDSPPVSADDIFHNGQIRPTYPLFLPSADADVKTTRRLPLRTLMFEDSNGLHGVEAGTYCVWTPPCKKTNSSSSSSSSSSSCKRWKLRDLLLRRQSDGKRTSKVAPKFVGFFSNANGLGRNNLRPFSS